MASLQEPSTVRFYAKEPNGNKHLLGAFRVEQLAPSGSADGVIQSTPEKWLELPMSNIVMFNDWTLEVTVELDASDGLDASDCIWSIPIRVKGVGLKHLSRSDFANPTFVDVTPPANVETTIAGYKITEGAVRFGGGKIFCAIEDDTA